MEQMENRKKYSEEFKKDAVRILYESGESITSVAESIGVDRSLLTRWKSRYGVEFEQTGGNSSGRTVRMSEFLSLKNELESVKESLNTLRGVIQKTLTSRYLDS